VISVTEILVWEINEKPNHPKP